MIQKRVLNYLDTICRPRLEKMLSDFKHSSVEKIAKIHSSRLSDSEKKYKIEIFQSKQWILETRLKDLNRIYCNLIIIKFQDSEDMGLVQDGVFCDREIIYYQPNIERWDDAKLAEAVLCAYFNSQQDYFMILHLSQSKACITRYLSQVMMYHIGMITHQLWYSQQHWKMSQRVYKLYPNFDSLYTTFQPTQYQADYMIRKVISHDDKDLFGKVDTSFSTDQAIEANIILRSWDVMQIGIIYHDIINHKKSPVAVYLLKNKDGSYTRTHPAKRELKDHKEASSLAKQFVV